MGRGPFEPTIVGFLRETCACTEMSVGGGSLIQNTSLQYRLHAYIQEIDGLLILGSHFTTSVGIISTCMFCSSWEDPIQASMN